MNPKLTTASYIERMKLLHNNKYDYSKTKYKTERTSIIIGCPTHGFVRVFPRRHREQGCPICSAKPRTRTRDTFVKKARSVHGNTYSYRKVKYESCNIPVSIKCRIHGYFLQKPAEHIRGTACPDCSRDRHRDTTESFIQKARKVHGNKYNYSNVEYKHSQLLVKIKCPLHGTFKQNPNNHLTGQGCAECGRIRRREVNAYQKKVYNLGSRQVEVQGYEPFAIDYLTKDQGIKPICIKVGVEVPVIRYKTKLLLSNSPYFKDRLYFPDLYLPKYNLIIEVKSPYTFLTQLPNILEKREATLHKGYRFHIMVMSKLGEYLELPNNWFNLTITQLENYLEDMVDT